MILARGLLVAHNDAVARCHALLEEYGWQGFIEESGHPAHDVRVILEEVLVIARPIKDIARLMEGAPGGADDIRQVQALSAQARPGIATARGRTARIAAHGGDQLEDALQLLQASIAATADAYRRMRPLVRDRTLADALFGPR